MIKNSMIRKYVIILALAVSAALFLPKTLLAQGAVVAYANYHWVDSTQYVQTGFPTDEQLDRLTHVMLVDLYTDTDGSVN